MGLNRGINGLQPCPVCHAPKSELHDCGKVWPLRSGNETQEIIAKSRTLGAKKGEELLKANSLRAIEVSYCCK